MEQEELLSKGLTNPGEVESETRKREERERRGGGQLESVAPRRTGESWEEQVGDPGCSGGPYRRSEWD